MDASLDHRGNMMEWDESAVAAYLSKLGYGQYEDQIREHHITGDILAVIDNDVLKELGVSTIGQRLHILKSVYYVKKAQGIPIEADHYVPPSEAAEVEESMSMTRLQEILREQGERLRMIEEENRRLYDNLQFCFDEISRIAPGRSSEDRSLRKQPSFKWANYVKPVRSPTRQDTITHTESPHPSPQKLEYDTSRPPVQSQNYQQNYDRSATQRLPSANTISSEGTAVLANASNRQNARQGQENASINASTDNLKSFKVSLEDPTWKVLPAALKKYKINNDDWQNYAMFICYGSTERCLSYDEKPLLLFQKLKDAKKNPVFMLKHIKDIRSPIVVAAQKHAARKASESSSPPKPATTPAGHAHNRSVTTRPSKLQVNGLTTGTPPLGTAGAQPAWPELMSPSTENKDKMDELGGDLKIRSMAAGSTTTEEAPEPSTSARHEGLLQSTGLSYAVAIYPYMAEQDDEFDVVVGDTFIIMARARGWWVVQRDPTGGGVVDPDTSKQGWVPAGCLLETNVPVAVAIAEANAARVAAGGSPPSTPTSGNPILPLSILSTSFPGVALMNYRKKGGEELDLQKDDLLRVFKRYNHWSYAVKEDGGDRGWVPSWFIGKVASAGAVPSTPNTSQHPVSSNSISASMQSSQTTAALDSDFRYAQESITGVSSASATLNQISPMSSAFPVGGQGQQGSSRTATTVI